MYPNYLTGRKKGISTIHIFEFTFPLPEQFIRASNAYDSFVFWLFTIFENWCAYISRPYSSRSSANPVLCRLFFQIITLYIYIYGLSTVFFNFFFLATRVPLRLTVVENRIGRKKCLFSMNYIFIQQVCIVKLVRLHVRTSNTRLKPSRLFSLRCILFFIPMHLNYVSIISPTYGL